MKRVFALLIALVLVTTACASNSGDMDGVPEGVEATALSGPMAPNAEGIIDIVERFFYLQFRELEFNQEAFLGQTIRYEGMFNTEFWVHGDAGGEYIHHVYRLTEPCCSPSEFVGLELYLGDFEAPEYNDWVQVTGVLDQIEDGGWFFLILRVTDLVVLEERGLEYINPGF